MSIASQARTAPSPVPVERGGALPLSLAQERVWSLDQQGSPRAFAPLSAVYRLGGPLDAVTLQRALDEIVARHEVLRTTFPLEEGRPRPRISPSGAVHLETVDVAAGGRGAAAEAEARRLVQAAASRPFDLARGPLIRAFLLRLGPDHHVLSVTMHPLVSDGWSLRILKAELCALYQAFCEGEASPLPPLPLQYADFAAWQRRSLAGDVLAGDLAWWAARLAGAPPALELPLQRSRPARQGRATARHLFEVPGPLGRSVAAVSRAHGTTPFVVLLAAFKVLLARYARSDDVVVATPVAGRDRAELEGLIGLFANTLLLRTDLSADPTFGEAVDRVGATTAAAYDHRDMPFELLVSELDASAGLGHTLGVQVLFELVDDEHGAPASLGPVELADLGGVASPYGGRDTNATTVASDLGLVLAPRRDGGMAGAFVYATERFDPATISRLAGHYSTLLEAAIAHPETPAGSLPLLSSAERHQILVEWNATARPYPQMSPAQLVSAQVARIPRSPAVTFEGVTLSFAELDERARRLGRRLAALGVGPDVPVGVYLERSAEMVVALLAIARAGATCPSTPTSRPSGSPSCWPTAGRR